MPKLSKDSMIKVGTKESKVEELIKTLIYLPAEQVVNYFQGIGLTIPRELRIYVLKETLRQRVAETRRSRGTLADELNYRLSWFSEFSETQLENLLVFFDDEQLVRNFLDDFWTDLLGYMVDKQVPPDDIKTLVDQSVKYVREKGLTLPDIGKYNRKLSVLFYDSFNRIDGLSPQKIRPVLYKSSTLNEIRDLGSKYGVNVPRRLKKNELVEIILNELKDKGEYTPALENQVKSMSVLVLQRFAIDHDIKASTELKKEEIIEYILKNANETREAYFVPSSIAAYDQEIEEISDEDQPEVVPVAVQVEEKQAPEQVVEEEPVVEEEIEEVKEEIKEEVKEEVKTKETVHVVEQHVNLDALVTEIKLLRETIERFEKKPVIEDQQSEEVNEIEETNVEETTPEVYPEKQAPIVVNTAAYPGDAKQFKKVLKHEAKEREAFIEKQKLEEEGKLEADQKLPGEVRAVKKVGIGLLKFLRFLLLKIVLPVLAIAIVLLALYGVLDFFTNITFLDGITDAINGFKIGQYGILEHFFNFLQNTLGLTPAGA